MANVYVGLSGGVDSATAAALLKGAGHNVTGVYIKIWQPEFIECTWREDRLDAMRVASALQIPFREIDLSEEYKSAVVERMIADYTNGITPNPDILCNEFIKFGAFMRYALDAGADRVATGHYARIVHEGAAVRLARGVDAAKDQSYFLHRISKRNLERTIFPVGAYSKSEIRDLARRFALPVAEKPDSQGLCFVGDVSMKDFLARFIELKKGDVVTASGEVVGVHDGAALYTVGQRHGFVMHAASAPHYVVGIDTVANTLTVSSDLEDAKRSSVRLAHMHWIDADVTYPVAVHAQPRYRTQALAAEISLRNGNAFAEFASPQLLSPGQSLVLYSGDICIGGGVIM